MPYSWHVRALSFSHGLHHRSGRAILEAGDPATITPATLHAQVDPALAAQVQVAAVDFESTTARGMQRFLIVAQGWNAGRFREQVAERLRRQHVCSLADVLGTVAAEAQVREIHLFAHWLADEETHRQLAGLGFTLITHPLECIRAASLVAGQRCRRWSTVPAA